MAEGRGTRERGRAKQGGGSREMRKLFSLSCFRPGIPQIESDVQLKVLENRCNLHCIFNSFLFFKGIEHVADITRALLVYLAKGGKKFPAWVLLCVQLRVSY